MRSKTLGVLLLLLCLGTAILTHDRASARPRDTPGVIPVESPIIDPPDEPIDPGMNGTTITVQTQVASPAASDFHGCPVYAEVLDAPQFGAVGSIRVQPMRAELQPIGGKSKATKIRQKADGKFYTTDGVKFKIEKAHAGKRLRIVVHPSNGDIQSARERTVKIK